MNSYLQSEVRMLEERLKNLEYLKQTYERQSKEKTLEIESLLRELNDSKSQLFEKTKKLEEISYIHTNNEATLLRAIDEHRSNKILLEDELAHKNSQITELEKNLQEQYEHSLKIIDENQELRKELREKEKKFAEHIFLLESKLKDINLSQKLTENRVNNIISATPGKRKPRIKKDDTGKISQLYKKELALNKSLKSIITDLYKNQPEDLEARLEKSEKKLKDFESILTNSKNDFYSPMTSLKTTAKLRSSSQSLKHKNSKY
jgi:hypothetical protein